MRSRPRPLSPMMATVILSLGRSPARKTLAAVKLAAATLDVFRKSRRWSVDMTNLPMVRTTFPGDSCQDNGAIFSDKMESVQNGNVYQPLRVPRQFDVGLA